MVDLDGTLLGPDGAVSAVTREALAEVRRAGIEVMIATGRPPALTLEVARRAGVRWVSCLNGTVVLDAADDVVIDQWLIAPGRARLAGEVARARVDDAHLAVELGDERFFYEPRFAEAIPLPMPDGGTPVVDALAHLDGGVRKVSVVPAGEVDMDLLLAELAAALPEGLGVNHAGLPFAEIGLAGVSKATSAAWLVDRLGLDARLTVAFGDNVNDHELLAWAGTGVAMGNARAVTRAAADVVCEAHDDDGVARALRRLLAGGSVGAPPARPDHAPVA